MQHAPVDFHNNMERHWRQIAARNFISSPFSLYFLLSSILNFFYFVSKYLGILVSSIQVIAQCLHHLKVKKWKNRIHIIRCLFSFIFIFLLKWKIYKKIPLFKIKSKLLTVYHFIKNHSKFQKFIVVKL